MSAAGKTAAGGEQQAAAQAHQPSPAKAKAKGQAMLIEDCRVERKMTPRLS